MYTNEELTLLTEGQMWGTAHEEQLEVLKKYGTQSAVSDLVVLTGGYCLDLDFSWSSIPEDNSLKGRVGWAYTQTLGGRGGILAVHNDGGKCVLNKERRNGAIRPVLLKSSVFSQISQNRLIGYNGTEEIEYGEYPQYAPDANTQKELERVFQKVGLQATGRNYTFDSTAFDDESQGFQAVTYDEYEYEGRKYIRVKANSDYDDSLFQLSNGEKYQNGDYVWVEVSPVKWLIDDKAKLLVSKIGLLSGIRFHTHRRRYKGNFLKTEMKEYLDKYMLKDLFQKATLTHTIDIDLKGKTEEKRKNLYGFNFDQVNEDQIIRGAIESGVALFLHGQSAEGKSARVKQIDPDCVIIHLGNATRESLNGKKIYNSETGETIDIKPTWLKQIEERCEKNPDKNHIVLFDKITNALPSIQSIVFNIVSDRQVNGIWHLPENARIVATGNDMKDSIPSNQLSESLFNRFAHVYIRTTVDSWLQWASTHNIHPAIYAYIACKKDHVLRSNYISGKPNADPRKWEMASKMLYATGQPEMLRALVGEDITRDFCRFCNQRVVRLADVLSGNYTERDLQMNIYEKYAAIIELSQVSEADFDKVRDFVSKLGPEFCTVFDLLWTQGNEQRIKLATEAKMSSAKGGKRL